MMREVDTRRSKCIYSIGFILSRQNQLASKRAQFSVCVNGNRACFRWDLVTNASIIYSRQNLSVKNLVFLKYISIIQQSVQTALRQHPKTNCYKISFFVGNLSVSFSLSCYANNQ